MGTFRDLHLCGMRLFRFFPLHRETLSQRDYILFLKMLPARQLLTKATDLHFFYTVLKSLSAVLLYSMTGKKRRNEKRKSSENWRSIPLTSSF